MDSVRLELVKRCIIHSFPRYPARCWQLHLALSHTVYATICWPIQERCSCADFCLQHCNKNNSSRTWRSTVGLLRAVPTYLTSIPIQPYLAKFLPPRRHQQCSLSGVHHLSLEVGRESRQNPILLAHPVLSCTFVVTHSLEISIRERAECTPLVQDHDSVLRLSSFSLTVLISRECATLLSRRENSERLFCTFPMWIELLSTHISRVKVFSLQHLCDIFP